ncbi:MAG: RnfABCDGE type electron transport complex subunit D [Firmicutes bacterium]|nr:RnfABCDGE type electron transport complex subunit D [Bacillota bacterium]
MTKFKVGPSPHILGPKSINSVMWDVVIALIPVTVAAVLYFGIAAVWVLLASTLSAMIVEALIIYRNLRPASIIGDGSAAVTGLLVGLIVPPAAPLWLAIIASTVAIVLGKHVFGGLGKNIFNPALVGRAFVFMSWAGLMTMWHSPLPFSNWFTRINADMVTAATPLGGAPDSLTDLVTGNIAGSLGETSVLAILLGGVYLFVKGHIDWRIPGFYLGTVAVFSLAAGQDPLFHITAGGVMFAAMFMATDMVTTPVTKTGRIVFGLGCGLITMFVRLFASAPEGVTYAILFMNALVPLIDRYSVPKTFGEVRGK